MSACANIAQRLYVWLAGWRSAPSPEMKRTWVQRFVNVAVLALNSGLLATEEFPPVLHEVLFIEADGPKELSPEERAAWEEVNARLDWQYAFFPRCSCVLCAKHALGLLTPETTPENSPERILTPPAVSSPGQQPQQKRGRGRPKGSGDIAPRDRRGTQKDWTKARKSFKSREGAKRRKAYLGQQQQQQQQTPPP